MKIAVCSMFRDSQLWHGIPTLQVDNYISQLVSMNDDYEYIVYAAEGDSVDNTRERLEYYQEHLTEGTFNIIDAPSAADVVGSVASNDRFAKLAAITNKIFDVVKNIEADYVFLVESDLIITNKDLVKILVEFIEGNPKVGIVAPQILYNNHGEICFYDTWGFRNTDDIMVPDTINNHLNGQIVKMNAVGSCAIIRHSLIKDGVNLGTGGWPEMCRQIREKGFLAILYSALAVFHPTNVFIKNRWV